MASIRDRILEALLAALSASGGPAGLLVTEERTHPVQTEQLPLIGLYFDDEEPLPLDKQVFRAPVTQKLLRVTVEYRAAVGSPITAPRKAIDPLYLWTMQQLGADETFGGLAMGLTEGPTKWLSQEADAIVAAAAQTFIVHYRTARLNPSTTS